MSQSYQVSIQQQRELERQRLAEEARQRRIEAERAQVAQIAQQRERLQAQQQAVREQLAARDAQAAAPLPSLSQVDPSASLEQILRQSEESLARLQADLANREARIQAMEAMTPDAYYIFTALERALAESHDMALTAVEQAEDGSWRALFNRLEDISQTVKINLEQSQDDTLLMDVTEGFSGDACNLFMEQVKTSLEARGSTLDYTPMGNRSERVIERDPRIASVTRQSQRTRN
jgi:hypothetical protein